MQRDPEGLSTRIDKYSRSERYSHSIRAFFLVLSQQKTLYFSHDHFGWLRPTPTPQSYKTLLHYIFKDNTIQYLKDNPTPLNLFESDINLVIQQVLESKGDEFYFNDKFHLTLFHYSKRQDKVETYIFERFGIDYNYQWVIYIDGQGNMREHRDHSICLEHFLLMLPYSSLIGSQYNKDQFYQIILRQSRLQEDFVDSTGRIDFQERKDLILFKDSIVTKIVDWSDIITQTRYWDEEFTQQNWTELVPRRYKDFTHQVLTEFFNFTITEQQRDILINNDIMHINLVSVFQEVMMMQEHNEKGLEKNLKFQVLWSIVRQINFLNVIGFEFLS